MAKAAAKNPIEVKIGVQYSPREISLEVEMTADEIRHRGTDAAVRDVSHLDRKSVV